jgi:hypothetical protein
MKTLHRVGTRFAQVTFRSPKLKRETYHVRQRLSHLGDETQGEKACAGFQVGNQGV